MGPHQVDVLRGVSAAIQAGEWVALTGASGSGKTTLMHLLGGLDRPTGGHVRCLGKKMTGSAATRLRRHHLGFVFQSYHLLPELSAVENVALPASGWGQSRSRAEKRAVELLTRFGLENRLKHRPLELSGGEQQRVAMARALVNNPDIILADEPTGNLDADAAETIMRILTELNTTDGRTIVMVTHDPACARRAQRVLHLTDGRVTPGS
ncbi:MAG: ABC transporter ATP-binding protein [Lentisphaeria bacterium]|nr:ABC transporter ATP-binding protein [Lentisphaeria bacterium]